ncbi:hypothetical protein KY284_001023 [Solanum tuberosum]|nr:hypothetical protein KY284_001023 [Solanum tuberosum]
MQASKASAEAAPGSTQGTSKEHLLGITKEVGKDLGLPEALRARMLALEDEVTMVMGQYLGAVEGFLGKFPSAYAVSSTPDAFFLSKTLAAGTHQQRLLPLQPRHSGLGANLMEPSNDTSAYRFLNKHSFLDFTSNKLSPYGVRPREKSNPMGHWDWA